LAAGRAVDYQDIIDNSVAKNHDLCAYELSADDWDAIALVTRWLKSFRLATTQMSTTKHSMLSSTHAIFRGLQDDVRNSLAALPDSAPAMLRTGLMKAHQKLSDYYTKLDESPYYIWAACEYSLSPLCCAMPLNLCSIKYWILGFHTKAS
jgi:hypothetical protein